MKVRLYDSGKRYEGFPDRYSLYFPYTQKMMDYYKKKFGRVIKGTFLGCSQASDGSVIRYYWEDLDTTIGYSIKGLGRKVKIESMSKQFQEFAVKMERIWNDAIKYDDKEHWDFWNKA